MGLPGFRSDYTLTNWSETLRCSPRRYFQPENEEEVRAIVAETRAAGRSLRVVGAGHSFSPVAMTDDTLLNLDRLDGLLAIDPARHRVTVGAGIRLKHLNELLDRHGLAMTNLGSIAEQSIAGAFSTGTHGTGLSLGILATLVTGVTLVTADGELLHLDIDRDPERMAAARVSLGCLGVITHVTLQCEPAYRLHEDAHPLPFEDVTADLDRLIHGHRHVRLYWFSHTDVIQVMTYDKTDRPITPRSRAEAWFKDVVLKHDLLTLLIENGYAIPGLVAPLNRFAARTGFVKEERVDRSDHILNIPLPPLHDECEYLVPLERAAEAMRMTRRLIERAEFRANIPVEFRFVAADDILLSPAYQRAGCYIGAYTFGEQFAVPYFAGFEGYMKSIGGRPHWGKYMTATPDELRALFPGYDRFRAIRREMDPTGTFLNPFTRELLAP